MPRHLGNLCRWGLELGPLVATWPWHVAKLVFGMNRFEVQGESTTMDAMEAPNGLCVILLQTIWHVLELQSILLSWSENVNKWENRRVEICKLNKRFWGECIAGVAQIMNINMLMHQLSTPSYAWLGLILCTHSVTHRHSLEDSANTHEHRDRGCAQFRAWGATFVKMTDVQTSWQH